jgi:3',5'-cyclic AMP phosphodiesterase CpdA
MTQRFIQLSDPHLSSLADVRLAELLNKRLLGYLSWRRKRRFEHRSEVLEALLEDLSGKSLSQVLVTGDLTHIGLPNEFLQVREWLQRLGAAETVALVPGNHDSCVPTPWRDTYALWEAYMASDARAGRAAWFPSLRIRGDVAFIGLSTACPTPPLMASGRVDDRQLAALPDVLEDTGGRKLFRVLYLHHSPVPGQEKWRKRLVNADAVAEVIKAHGAELVLHGHGHRTRRDTLESRCGDVPVIAVPSASALGLHGADIAAYNCYRVERSRQGWDLEIRTRRYHPERGRFDDGEVDSVRIGRR